MSKLNGSVDVLYKGCTLRAITHALWARQYPFAKYLFYWDDINCHINDMEGNLATISFFDDGIVGAIFRKDYFETETAISHLEFVNSILASMPSNLKKRAESETLQYFIQVVDEEKIPIVTNIFWSEEDDLISTISQVEWSKIWDKLIRIQLMDTERAFHELQKDYELNIEELKLIELLYIKRNKSPLKQVKIKLDSVFEKILNKGEGEITKELLERIGITLTNRKK